MSSSSSKKPVSQNQKLIPFPPRPNRFSPLTPDKKPILFSEVLQTQESKLLVPNVTPIKTVTPFPRVPITKSLQTIPSSSSPSKTAYVVNPNYQRVQILEDYQISKLNQGFHILTNYLFGQGKTFFSSPYKTREYYQAILEETNSVQFNHCSNSQNGNIDYSKAHIFKIISPEGWGINPYSEKLLTRFPTYPRYSYYDYQEAWFKAFLLRNYSHSWFFFFDLNFDCEYPRWFVTWYKSMGLLPNCLPKEVEKGFIKFKELFVQTIPEFEYLLQFTMFCKIPWIMSWTYHYQEAKETSPPWLNRQYRIKWWDKFKIEQADDQIIIKKFQEMYQPIRSELRTSQLSENELISRIVGASKSSKEEIQQLLQDIRSSPSGSEGSPTCSTTLNAPFQDAQDPFEDPYED